MYDLNWTEEQFDNYWENGGEDKEIDNYIDGIVDGYSHYTDATGDYIEISKLANTTYIGICSTIANFSNDEYDKLIEWCLSVMSQMKEELANG